MGQEQSSPVDDSTPSRTLRERSVDAVAQYIKDGGAKKIVVMVSLSYNSVRHSGGFESASNRESHRCDRLGLALARLPVFQTSDPQKLASMPTLRDSIYPIQRLSLTYHFSETTHCLSTPSLKSCTLENTGQPSHIALPACSRTKVSC